MKAKANEHEMTLLELQLLKPSCEHFEDLASSLQKQVAEKQNQAEDQLRQIHKLKMDKSELASKALEERNKALADYETAR